MSEQIFPSIAHCAMHLIYHHKEWTNKQIADEVKRITGSRTGPGNISWYKGKLKKGLLNIEDYLDSKKVVEADPSVIAETPVEIPLELIVTDEDLITAKGIQKLALEFLRNKNEKTFNALYARLKPGMTYHAMSILKDQYSADDVVSVAFTKMWIKIDQYNKYWNFSTWAYRIVRNEAMQYIRKNKMVVGLDAGTENHSDASQKTNYDESGEYKDFENEDLIFDPETDNEDLHQQVYDKVLNEINNLPKFYKDIMIDREIGHKGPDGVPVKLKYKQIADKYKININSVKTRIKRARMQIINNNQEYYRMVQAKKKKNKTEIHDEFEFREPINITRTEETGDDFFDVI